MTGVVEAGVVLGLISSSVDIYKTCYEIYQVAQDLDGLTPEFKNVADLIPLMLMSLESAQHNIGTQCPPSEVVQVSENCKAHALEVKNTFDKILPSTGDTKTARFTKALNLKWKSRDVRKTMEMAFRDIDLLANHRVLCDSEAIKEVKEAIQQLADMKANEAQGVTVNHGNIMNARDSARIDARSFNASDQARQYSAETMHFENKYEMMSNESSSRQNSMITLKEAMERSTTLGARQRMLVRTEEWGSGVMIHSGTPQAHPFNIFHHMSLYDAESTLERLSSDKHRDTTNWILDAEPFKEWLDRPIGSCFVSTGLLEPGKTICTVAVFESLKESPATSQRQVYQFFYEAAMWDHYTGLDLLEALVKQMVLTNPDIRSDLHDRTWRYYGPQSNRPHLAQLGKYLFLPLARQLKNPIFVVDGIDESETSRAEIVQLLSAAADEGASVFINARKQIRFEPALKNVRLVSAVQKKLFPSVWPRPIVGCSAEEASSPITAVVKSPIDPLDDYTHLINTAGLCLLSIDGGGARGLSPLYLLKAIMDQLNEQRARLAQPRVRPCDVFDLIGGTSTGGLIAIMLGRLEMDVDECITAYRLLAESVFGVAARRSSTGEIRAKSDSKALDEAIQRMIIGKDQAVDCAFDDGCRRGCKTFVCALDAFTQHITRFRTYSLPEEISLQSTVREAALATFATTSLILPVKVNRWSFAGGRVVADNPLNEVEGEASAIWCPMTADLKPLVKCIVSIGAGHPGLHPVEDSPRRSPSNVLVASETEHTAEVFCARWARHYNEGRYFRFSVEHGLQHRSLTEYFEPGLVKDATKHYMSHTTQRRRIGDCIRNLGTKESYTPLDIAERIRRSLH